MNSKNIARTYELARERFGEVGVDTEAALKKLATIPISLHCWQGDDVGGFEKAGSDLGGGLAVTGNYPGKARTPAELRADVEKTFSLVPGKHRFNLHASYVEFPAGKRVDRDELAPAHFLSWIQWAKAQGIGIDFNPTLFAHPKAADGFTLSHKDKGIRKFWIEHCAACRKIGAAFGKALGTPCVTNIWIPDGMKDTPADRWGPRERLRDALDEIFAQPLNPKHNLDAIEGKLFGIGAESYTVGSHEFYLGYAVAHKKLLTLDAGHYHPTESLADKLSAVMLFVEEILLHVSRGVRWDSDHVVVLNDDLLAIGQEIVWSGRLDRIHIGLDYFDASINRLAAWVIGLRNMLKALLMASLAPVGALRQAELAGDYTSRLALMEEMRLLPYAAVWDYYCESRGAPARETWLAEIKQYEKTVLSKRS